MNTKKILLFSFLVLFLNGLYGSGNDTLLYHIEDKVYNAFLASFKDNNPKQLMDMELKLKKMSNQNPMAGYWFAFSKYYESIYYLKMQDKKNSSKELDAGILMLEDIKNKNSEHYALIAFLQGFSIQYYGGMSAAAIAIKAKQNAETALKLDSSNLRAWYVLASNDYHTPVAYGGGKKCESYLLKAISLNDQIVTNPYMPSWGKKDAFSLLLDYYLSKEAYINAKKYLAKAQAQYPDDDAFKHYVELLKDK